MPNPIIPPSDSGINLGGLCALGRDLVEMLAVIKDGQHKHSRENNQTTTVF